MQNGILKRYHNLSKQKFWVLLKFEPYITLFFIKRLL